MKTEWISIKDKLPKQGMEVIVFWKDHKRKRHMCMGKLWKGNYRYDEIGWHFTYYDCDGANQLDDSQVTHWMRKPKQPSKAS